MCRLWVQEKIQGATGETTPTPQGETPAGEPVEETPVPEEEQGYSDEQQQGIDQLIENSDGATPGD